MRARDEHFADASRSQRGDRQKQRKRRRRRRRRKRKRKQWEGERVSGLFDECE
jgi:hypothetical protein